MSAGASLSQTTEKILRFTEQGNEYILYKDVPYVNDYPVQGTMKTPDGQLYVVTGWVEDDVIQIKTRELKRDKSVLSIETRMDNMLHKLTRRICDSNDSKRAVKAFRKRETGIHAAHQKARANLDLWYDVMHVKTGPMSYLVRKTRQARRGLDHALII